MLDHVTVRVSDLAASRTFYETVLATLGGRPSSTVRTYVEWDDFSIAAATPQRPVTRNLHIGFVAPSREHVDAFWHAGVDAGFRDDGAPGPRPEYRDDYYGAFLRDPDGNSAEAVHHGAMRGRGRVDHLWIRVADVAATRRFYETIAPFAGLETGHHDEGLVQWRHGSGSFSLLAGRPTEHVHLAFAARDHATVDAFHRAALAAGYRDDGAPGERPEYHAGYYAAFVLDPDGHNVELVHHG